MAIDFLIIGQGISGTWLSYYLEKAGKSFLVIDNNAPHSSSRLAAGVINPVTGRRHVEVWMAEKILPFAKEAYEEFGKKLQLEIIQETSIVDFFPSAQMRQSFFQRIEENGQYVFDYPGYNEFYDDFQFDFGCGEIKPAYIVQLEKLLPAWRAYLKKTKRLLEQTLGLDAVTVSADKVYYQDIEAGAIIFCDGAAAAENPWFNLLPFALNKGEILLAGIPGLPPSHIYKKGIVLVPQAEKDMWWIGSNYAWEFDNTAPTTSFREATEAQLRHWLKRPFKILDHLAGVRPATLERRPFVGMHPHHPVIGILNGMGTKGCSLAPWFAKQLADHLCYQQPLDPDADINRFQKILSRKFS